MCYKPPWDLLKISLAWPYLTPSLNLTLFLVPTPSYQSFMPHQNHFFFCKMQVWSITFLLKTFWEFCPADMITSRVVKSLLRGSIVCPNASLFMNFPSVRTIQCLHNLYCGFSFIFTPFLSLPNFQVSLSFWEFLLIHHISDHFPEKAVLETMLLEAGETYKMMDTSRAGGTCKVPVITA